MCIADGKIECEWKIENESKAQNMNYKIKLWNIPDTRNPDGLRTNETGWSFPPSRMQSVLDQNGTHDNILQQYHMEPIKETLEDVTKKVAKFWKKFSLTTVLNMTSSIASAIFNLFS